ncbi:hypothetical protein HDU99_000998 [Rhizoclosmatium hyalinum]|nr:hypothetical protein HDU99_000998 [Rhizoclosmatium hyalinum]
MEHEPTEEEIRKAQRKALKKASAEADKQIRQLDHSLVAETINKSNTILFFGATYCPFTHRFTPKWLEFQQLYDSNDKWKHSFAIFKVQCAHDESFCIGMGTSDGYPTIYAYHNGIRVEEFDTDWDLAGWANWLVGKLDSGSYDQTGPLNVEENIEKQSNDLEVKVEEGSVEVVRETTSTTATRQLSHTIQVNVPASILDQDVSFPSIENAHIISESHTKGATKLQIDTISTMYLLFAASILIAIWIFVNRRRSRTPAKTKSFHPRNQHRIE